MASNIGCLPASRALENLGDSWLALASCLLQQKREELQLNHWFIFWRFPCQLLLSFPSVLSTSLYTMATVLIWSSRAEGKAFPHSLWWFEMCPHRLTQLNTWSSGSDAVWGGYGTFWRWSFGGGKCVMGSWLWVFIALPHFLVSLSLLLVYGWNVVSQLPAPAAMPA